MNWLQEQLRNTTPPDLILHLGAGSCGELDQWLNTGARRVVLVEPNPEFLPALRDRVRDEEAVQVIPAAVSAHPGRSALRLYNFPMLSSLREPTGICESLPGLRQIGRAMVDTLPVNELLDRIGLEPNANNWLVIDAPGEEAAILQALEKDARLMQFETLIMTAGTESLYQGAEPASKILDRLRQFGYRITGNVDGSDADWPRYRLIIDRVATENKRLHEKLKVLQKRFTELEVARRAERETHESEIAALRSQLTASDAALQSEAESHEAERKTLQDHVTELESSRQAERESHESNLDMLRSKLVEAEAANESASQTAASELEALRQQVAEAELAGEELAHSLQEELREERSAAEQRAQEQLEEIIRLREDHAKAIARLETERDQATAQLEQARAELQSQREAESGKQQQSSEQIEQLQKQLAEKDQTIAELTQKTNQLNAKLRESQDQVEEHAARVEMIQQEIARTDGQIDLIKDLLLRESLS